QSMLFNTVYQEQKNLIEHHVSLCTNGLINDARTAKDQAVTKLELVLLQQKLLTVALLLVVLVLATEMLLLVLRPIRHYIESNKEDKPLVAEGAYDLRYLAEAYNEMYEENRIRRERLQHAAEHDPLTGLYNRGAYDVLIEDNTKDIALLLIDIDHFKEVNDTYGHAVGDEVLKKVARLLSSTFRATDYPCRIGGDEFAVIMTGVDSNLSLIVEDKIAQVTDALREPEGEIPGLTLSIGIAFSDELEGSDAAPTTFKAADQALYVVKERGRNGHLFYHEIAG
ncbi:MAG: GGDEF domain-containing protein, partial [Atopobiaceae bacterium]|nr:GGDEF domain-containing protein [Atopobiaceae bacterium]